MGGKHATVQHINRNVRKVGETEESGKRERRRAERGEEARGGGERREREEGGKEDRRDEERKGAMKKIARMKLCQQL